MDGKPTTISMTEAEVALYQSGQRKGHAECLRQIEMQLILAAKKYRADEDVAMEQRRNPDDGTTSRSAIPDAIADAFENISRQFNGPAELAQKEQQQLLDRWCVLRTRTDRTFAERLKAAFDGALAGWRAR